jgi:hypothetical protein
MFSSKKKATPAPAAPVSSKADPKAAERLFDSLVDPDDPDTMYMDGISKLCENLGMDPAADVRVLVMLWKLGAVSKPGSITRSEFLSGFQKLQVSDTERLKMMVPSFDPGFMDKSEFRGTVQFTPRHTFCAELTSAALRRVQISTSSYFSFHGRGRIRPLVSKISSESRPMFTTHLCQRRLFPQRKRSSSACCPSCSIKTGRPTCPTSCSSWSPVATSASLWTSGTPFCSSTMRSMPTCPTSRKTEHVRPVRAAMMLRFRVLHFWNVEHWRTVPRGL